MAVKDFSFGSLESKKFAVGKKKKMHFLQSANLPVLYSTCVPTGSISTAFIKTGNKYIY